MSKPLLLFAVALVWLGAVAVHSEKVALNLQKSLATKSRANIFITLRETTAPVLAQVAKSTFDTQGAKATAVYNALKSHATKSQAPVLAKLNVNRKCSAIPCPAAPGKIQSFWISNQIYVEGADLTLVNSMAEMDEVAEITEEEILQFDVPIEGANDAAQDPSILAEWGITRIQAEQAWDHSTGGRGENAVVGIIDTGARWTHESIRAGFRVGIHSWYDPYRFSQSPIDTYGHGTHVTGTIVGSETSGIGVAPLAKWIACKADDEFGGAPQRLLLDCAQFIACPHDPNGDNHDCTKAPHVVSNSWGGPDGSTWFDSAIASWKTAGIIPVFALGNNGGLCRTCGYPGSHPDVLGVGATTSTDAIASFSSRGPSNAGVFKPDVSAPGNDIRSASQSSDNLYTSKSGTSMACPHVAGLVAIIKGRYPQLNFSQVRTILRNSTDRNMPGDTRVCEGVPNNVYPNYMFGYGRINALQAVQLAHAES